jgi:2-polyprenyl-3-methyl-5-hydroxy-6-metoxy-1,4-benzoquinol methylase
MAQCTICPLCGMGRYSPDADQARVHSNVRRWTAHAFTVWRCAECGALHRLEDVDVAPYYEGYPYGQRRLDGFTRHVFRHYLARLERHGLKSSGRILDYGCSQGLLMDYLGERGYGGVAGYDPYTPGYDDPAVLERPYDAVIAQDVIEHVEDPHALMQLLARSARPGGLVCIGTPCADAVDLRRTEDTLHSLHQPYHPHIFSERAMRDAGERAGLRLESLERRHSCDTPAPFVNWTFLKAYIESGDNTLDAGFDPPRIAAVAMSPKLWFYGLFGYWLPLGSEMIALFRKPGG